MFAAKWIVAVGLPLAIYGAGCDRQTPPTARAARPSTAPASPSVMVMEGNVVPLLPELHAGTATWQQAQDWSRTALESPGPLDFSQHPLRPGGPPSTFICNPSLAGTGGNTYIVLEQTPAGWRYLGALAFGVLTPLAPDAQGRPQVQTYWHLSASEGAESTYVLTGEGFQLLTKQEVKVEPQ